MKKSASTRNQTASTWMVGVAVIPTCIFFSFMSNYGLSLQLSERTTTKPIQVAVEQPEIVLQVDSSISLSTLKQNVHIPLFYMPKHISTERCLSSTSPSPFWTECGRVTLGAFFLVQDLSLPKTAQ